MSRKIKVLLSAYACEPGKGSEPGVGWTWALAAAKHHQVWVITRANNIPVIEAWEKEHGKTNITWIGYDGPTWRCQFKKQFPKGDHWYYSWWQKAIVPLVSDWHDRINFDLIHHVTFVTHQYPCHLHRVGPPLIFGPLAGADQIPASLRAGLSLKDRLVETLRDVVIKSSTLRPSIRKTMVQASQVIAANPTNARFIKAHYRRAAIIRPAMTVDKSLSESVQANRKKGGLRLLTAGRLIGLKGHWLSLKAMEHLPSNTTLDIVGNGPDKKRLQKLAKALGIAERISWHQWMSQADLHQLMRESDGFLAPSLRDSGGMAVLEAMSCGCPVVAIALGGPELSVNHGVNGFLVQPGSVTQVVDELTACCKQLEGLSQSEIVNSVAAFSAEELIPVLDNLYNNLSASS